MTLGKLMHRQALLLATTPATFRFRLLKTSAFRMNG